MLGRIQFSEELEGDAKDIFKGIERAGLEGMVSKRLGSRYRSGPSKEWLKAKCCSEDVFDVAGVLRERGKPTMALVASEGKYVGGAFVTLPKIRKRLWARVQAKATCRNCSRMSEGTWKHRGQKTRIKCFRSFNELVVYGGCAVAKAKDDTGLKAVHRGGGSYSIVRGDEEVAEKLSKEDAEAFNAMSDADEAAYVEANKA